MERTKTRNSNLELYRILCMLLIVAHHFAVHGFAESEITYCLNKYVVDLFASGGKIGVDGFILISGYFMVNSQYNFKKFLKLEGEVWFYSVGIILLFLTVLHPTSPFGIGSMIKAAFPLIFNEYWFVTSFVVLMLFSPVLNHIAHTVRKQTYQMLLGIIFVCAGILPVFLNVYYMTDKITWFVFLYLLAGYVRLYCPAPQKRNGQKHFMVAVFFYLLLAASSIACNWAGAQFGSEKLLQKSRYFMLESSPLVFIVSFELFMGFLRMKEFKNKTINMIAGAAFGVYLIHDNKFMRGYLWDTIFQCKEHYQSSFLPLYGCMAVLLIYIVCTCVELIRQRTVEKIWMRFVQDHADQIEQKACRIMQRIGCFCKKIGEKYYG